MASVLVCQECGHRNPSGTAFCENCGNFLDWSGAAEVDEIHVGAAAAPGPASAPAPGPAAVPLPAQPDDPSQDVAQRVGDKDPEPQQTVVEPETIDDTFTVEDAAPPLPPASRSEPEPEPPPVTGGWQTILPGSAAPGPPPRAASPPPAVAAAAPGAAQTVRKPTEQKERHVAPQRRESRPKVAPGETTCPVCGTGNATGRRFCRRCGATLATASRPDAMAHPSRLPSEQQLRAAQRRYRRALVIQHRVGRITALSLGVLALLYALAAALNIGGLGQWTRDRVNQVLSGVPVPGLVATVVPEESLPDLGPAHAVDPIAAGTAWATNWSGPPSVAPEVPPVCSLPENSASGTLVIQMPQGTPVSRVAIGGGLAQDDPARLAQWRPTAVHLRFSDGSCVPMRLADTAAMQDVHVNVRAANWLQLVVVAAAPPETGSSEQVAISTVQVFSPRWR